MCSILEVRKRNGETFMVRIRWAFLSVLIFVSHTLDSAEKSGSSRQAVIENRDAFFTTPQSGNVLSKINTSFEVGLRNSDIQPHSEKIAKAVLDEKGTSGSLCLRVESGRRWVTEMLPVKTGKYTFAFDVRGEMGARFNAVVSSVVISKGKRDLVPLGSVSGKASGTWERKQMPVDVPDSANGFIYLEVACPDLPEGKSGISAFIDLDAVSLKPGEDHSYAPPVQVELALETPTLDASFTEGEDAIFDLRICNVGKTECEGTLQLTFIDLLYEKTTSIPAEKYVLKSGQKTAKTFRQSFPVGQFLVLAEFKTPEETVLEDKVISIKIKQRTDPSPRSVTRFMGRFLNTPLEYAMARDLGISSCRLHPAAGPKKDLTYWGEIEPEKNVYRFEVPDQIISEVGGAGFELLGILNYSHKGGLPKWVESLTPEKSGYWGAENAKPIPKDLTLWSNYVFQMANRYKGKISAWEIHNEPSGLMTAENYVPQLKIAADVIRKVDVSAKIIGICSTSDGAAPSKGLAFGAFIEDCLKLGAGENLDAISFHPYVWPFPPESKKFEETIAEIRGYRDRYAPKASLWNTEYGWNTRVAQPNRPSVERGAANQIYHSGEYTPIDGANFCVRSILFQKRYGIDVIVFSVLEPGAQPYRNCGSGLVDYDGTPKPVYYAYRTAIQYLADAVFLDEWRPQNAYVQAYECPDSYFLAIWKSEETPSEPRFRLKSSSAVVRDLFGRVLTKDLTSANAFSLSPQYIFVDKKGLSMPEFKKIWSAE